MITMSLELRGALDDFSPGFAQIVFHETEYLYQCLGLKGSVDIKVDESILGNGHMAECTSGDPFLLMFAPSAYYTDLMRVGS